MATTTTSHKTAAQSFLKLAASGDVRRAFSMYAGDGFLPSQSVLSGNG